MNRYEKTGLVLFIISLELLSMIYLTYKTIPLWGFSAIAIGGSIIMFLWGDK